ncbi:MAG: 6,7-dimethyl-8-ribityllumazine synthase [Verrucomicrobia bacterium]|nr:6,7-dimethyl-8-ribityllumazine synthase [Verrucomicrobiota bacterium]
MLSPFKTQNFRAVRGARIGLVGSLYNDQYVSGMLRAAERILEKSKAKRVRTVRVPGAFEIPVAAARLLRASDLDLEAVICLGVVMQGETKHADHIVSGVTTALAELQVETGKAVIHGVYLFETPSQAESRCLSPRFNRGKELAMTALQMVATLRSLPSFSNE